MSEEMEIDAVEVDAEDIAKSCKEKPTPYVCADCGRTCYKHRLSRRVR